MKVFLSMKNEKEGLMFNTISPFFYNVWFFWYDAPKIQKI